MHTGYGFKVFAMFLPDIFLVAAAISVNGQYSTSTLSGPQRSKSSVRQELTTVKSKGFLRQTSFESRIPTPFVPKTYRPLPRLPPHDITPLRPGLFSLSNPVSPSILRNESTRIWSEQNFVGPELPLLPVRPYTTWMKLNHTSRSTPRADPTLWATSVRDVSGATSRHSKWTDKNSARTPAAAATPAAERNRDIESKDPASSTNSAARRNLTVKVDRSKYKMMPHYRRLNLNYKF
ncbi:unnamed protein product [Cylicocyclus nassatus]|uniref:Uncharacterized protein n=1 Tax=Cylicocyclus nassatus TaxID=53992 RepID=A0AA36GKI4_CYLNA|nr:unnamed protein product [Cylicocyclus nassatus]